MRSVMNVVWSVIALSLVVFVISAILLVVEKAEGPTSATRIHRACDNGYCIQTFNVDGTDCIAFTGGGLSCNWRK